MHHERRDDDDDSPRIMAQNKTMWLPRSADHATMLAVLTMLAMLTMHADHADYADRAATLSFIISLRRRKRQIETDRE